MKKNSFIIRKKGSTSKTWGKEDTCRWNTLKRFGIHYFNEKWISKNDDIAAEFLKSTSNTTITSLLDLINVVWTSGTTKRMGKAKIMSSLHKQGNAGKSNTLLRDYAYDSQHVNYMKE